MPPAIFLETFGLFLSVTTSLQMQPCNHTKATQSRIIGAVREAHSQLWEITPSVFSPYALRKYDKRFGTPAIV